MITMKKIITIVLSLAFLFSAMQGISVCAENQTGVNNEDNGSVIEYDEDNPPVIDFDNMPKMGADFTPPAIEVDTMEYQSEFCAVPAFILTIGGKVAAWAGNKAFNWVNNNCLDNVLNSAEQDKIAEILKNQQALMDQLKQISNQINKINFADKIDEKSKRNNKLNIVAETTLEAYSNENNTELDKKNILKTLYDTSINNYVMEVLDYYESYIEGVGMINGNIFNVYDAYARYNFWWEHEGYSFREDLRQQDITNFYEICILAIYACEAHIELGTECKAQAQAAQNRLIQCLTGAKRSDGSVRLEGLVSLAESHAVERLPENQYKFIADGSDKIFYIPKDGFTPKKEEFKAYIGCCYDDAVKDYYYHIRTDDAIYDIATESDLKPLLDFYNSRGKKTLRQIFSECFPIPDNFKGMQENTYFHKINLGLIFHRYWYARLINIDATSFKHEAGYTPMVNATYSNPSSKKITKVKKVTENTYLAVGIVKDDDIVKAFPYPSQPDREIISGIVTSVADDKFDIGILIGNEDNEEYTTVSFDSNTHFANNDAVTKDSLINAVGKTVEIDGLYNYDIGEMVADTITIVDDQKQYTVQGTITALEDYDVLIEDQESKVHYFYVTDVDDLTLDSKVQVRYSWNNGVKQVDDIHLVSINEETSNTEIKEDINVNVNINNNKPDDGDNNPGTGDKTNFYVIAFMILISLCVVLIIGSKDKKYNK